MIADQLRRQESGSVIADQLRRQESGSDMATQVRQYRLGTVHRRVGQRQESSRLDTVLTLR